MFAKKRKCGGFRSRLVQRCPAQYGALSIDPQGNWTLHKVVERDKKSPKSIHNTAVMVGLSGLGVNTLSAHICISSPRRRELLVA